MPISARPRLEAAAGWKCAARGRHPRICPPAAGMGGRPLSADGDRCEPGGGVDAQLALVHDRPV